MDRVIGVAVSGLIVASTFAQSPAPPLSPSAHPTATPTAKAVTPTPLPAGTPTTEELINSLGQSDLQAAITLLKNNFTNPDAIDETELNRATLEGLLARHPRGLMLLPGRENSAPVE